MGLAKTAKELKVYQQAYALAMEIFEISKGWPKEEKYSLTDQVRRSSRAVCAKRMYPFICQLKRSALLPK